MSKRGPTSSNNADEPPCKQTAGETADSHIETLSLSDVSERSTQPPSQNRNKNNPRNISMPVGILSTFVHNYTGPVPCHSNEYFVIFSNALNSFAVALRNQILNVLYPDGDYAVDGVISEEHFQLVVSYLLKSRIDHVYSMLSGRQPPDRIRVSSIQIPKSLTDLINGIGSYCIHAYSVLCIPQPQAPPTDQAARLMNRVTHDMLNQFSTFITTATQRNVIRVSTISRVPEGTAYWLLTTRSTTNRTTTADITTQDGTVWAQFSEWTVSDGLLNAISLIGTNGYVFTGCHDLYFTMPAIVDLIGIRVSYTTLA